MMVVADVILMAEAPEPSLYRQPSLVVQTGKVTAALRRNLLVGAGKGGGCIAESLADVVFGLLDGITVSSEFGNGSTFTLILPS